MGVNAPFEPNPSTPALFRCAPATDSICENGKTFARSNRVCIKVYVMEEICLVPSQFFEKLSTGKNPYAVPSSQFKQVCVT